MHLQILANALDEGWDQLFPVVMPILTMLLEICCPDMFTDISPLNAERREYKFQVTIAAGSQLGHDHQDHQVLLHDRSGKYN